MTIGSTKLVIDFTMITTFITALCYFSRLRSLKQRGSKISCKSRTIMIWVYILAFNMYIGSMMVFSARIIRSFEWHTIPTLRLYLLFVRDFYWPIAHFFNAVTLSIFFYHQT